MKNQLETLAVGSFP